MFRATLEAGLTGYVFVEVWEFNAAEQRYMRGVARKATDASREMIGLRCAGGRYQR